MAKGSRGGGKGSSKIGIKEPTVYVSTAATGPPGKPPKHIRMLISLADSHQSYPEGTVYRVPHDVRVKTARSWIHSAAAEKVD